MGLIYKITSPSQGIYIGQTKYTEEYRWNTHCTEALRENGSEYNTILGKAIRKYGRDTFQHEILEDHLKDNELDYAEIYWIAHYHSFYKENPHGYNMTRGGQGVTTISRDIDKLILKWNEGYSLNEMAKQFDCHPNTMSRILHGFNITHEEIVMRGQQCRNITLSKNIPNADTIWLLWQSGMSLIDIEKETDVERHTISNFLTNIHHVTENDKKLHRNHSIGKKLKIPIIQYDLNNNYIQEWDSATTASKTLHIDLSSIRKCTRGQKKSAGGFIWKDKENN